jgi:tetratricopeptide (TPR) repeat protein
MRAAVLAALLFWVVFASKGAVDTAIQSIQAAIERGDHASASRLLSEALARHPMQAGLINLRGVLHAQRNELSEARADFQEAVDLAPALLAAWQNLGRACRMLAERDASATACAIAAWEHVIRERPSDIEARAGLGTLYEWQGRFADSLREIEKLPGTEGSRSAMLALRCADLLGLHRESGALQAAKRLAAAADLAEADVAAMAPVLDRTRSANVVIPVIEALNERGQASAGSLRRLAVAYEQESRLTDARRTLERVAALDPGNAAHLLELARIAHLSHDLEGSLGYLAHARDLAPGDARVHFLFGLVTVEMNLPLEARKSLQKALSLDPANPDYHYALGAVLLSAGNAGGALPYFTQYVAMRPNDARGHFALGATYFASGDYDHCREQMTGIIEDGKTAAGAAYFLGRVARVAENYSEAARYLERAIRLLPSFPGSYAELAHVRLRQKQYEAARESVGRALALDPESFQANSVLLALYQRTHDPRAEEQAARLRKLDEQRSMQRELMLRSIEVKPF